MTRGFLWGFLAASLMWGAALYFFSVFYKLFFNDSIDPTCRKWGVYFKPWSK